MSEKGKKQDNWADVFAENTERPDDNVMICGEQDKTCACPGQAHADAAAGENGENELASLRSRLAEQEQRAEDYFARLARVQADYENYKRRTGQEKEEYYKYASEQLIVALLPVLDNFDRALAAESLSVDDFKSGMEMIYRQLQSVLQAEGLEPVPAVGEPFDPVKHDAVLRGESDEYPENTVIEELQRGYYLKEKVIRVSMVKISQ